MMMSFGFGLFELMFSVMFLFVIGIFIATAVKGIGQWNKNNNSPRLTVQAQVVAKREHYSRRNHTAGDMEHAGYRTSVSTQYYVTFQVESGDRMELCVDGSEYGLMVEGDSGKLTFQGTRFISFQRIY